MIVSYNWLKELVKLNVPAEKLAEEMSLYSIEVESFKKLVEATNLVVGHVIEKKPHENSDHLVLFSQGLQNANNNNQL